MNHPDFSVVAVYELTLTGKVKAGFQVSLKMFVIARTYEEVITVGRQFFKEHYPTVDLRTAKASLAVEELLVSRAFLESVDRSKEND